MQWQDLAMAPIFAMMAAAVSAYVSLGIAIGLRDSNLLRLEATGIDFGTCVSFRWRFALDGFAGAALHGIPI